MDDLISRQQAIDTLENTKTAISENGERYIAKQNAIMRIDALPSAQPTFDARDTQYNLPIGTDLISRQAAKDALNHELRCGAVINQCGLEAAYEVIEDLPSAQPKRGKWIDRGEHGDWEWQADGRGKHWHEWECNICHHYFDERTFFCPHCGTDMREETT